MYENEALEKVRITALPVPCCVPTHHPHWFWFILPVFLIQGANVYGNGSCWQPLRKWHLRLRPEGWPGCVNHVIGLFLMSTPNNCQEILPKLEGANMPLGESSSFVQQTNISWACVGTRGARCWAEVERSVGVRSGEPRVGVQRASLAPLWPWALTGSQFSPL